MWRATVTERYAKSGLCAVSRWRNTKALYPKDDRQATSRPDSAPYSGPLLNSV
jgi:hypothetical protein